MEEVTPAFLIPLELFISLYPILELHFEKKKRKTRAIVEKMACIEVCVQYTWTQFSPLPMSYLT